MYTRVLNTTGLVGLQRLFDGVFNACLYESLTSTYHAEANFNKFCMKRSISSEICNIFILKLTEA